MPRLEQPEDVRRELRSDARLGAQAGGTHDGAEGAAEVALWGVGLGGGGGVVDGREDGTVGLDDEGWDLVVFEQRGTGEREKARE